MRNPFRRRKTLWQRKQELARPARYYGSGGTIHKTVSLDICLDSQGNVAQVWFRCQPLPFRVSPHTLEYQNPDIGISGVEVLDNPDRF